MALLTPRCSESCERISSKPDGVRNSAGAPIARYISPTVAATGRAIGFSVAGVDADATGLVASAAGALKEAPSVVPAGAEMVALGGVIAKGKLPSDALAGNKLAPVRPLFGERLRVPEGKDEGLSEGHNERY